MYGEEWKGKEKKKRKEEGEEEREKKERFCVHIADTSSSRIYYVSQCPVSARTLVFPIGEVFEILWNSSHVNEFWAVELWDFLEIVYYGVGELCVWWESTWSNGLVEREF